MTVLNAPTLRRLVRAVALVPLALVVLAAPAMADTPESWDDPAPISTLDTLLILVAIPVGLFLVIALLVYIPTMSRGERYVPGLAWRNENEWFGGPEQGLEAADEPAEGTQDDGRGGARARW